MIFANKINAAFVFGFLGLLPQGLLAAEEQAGHLKWTPAIAAGYIASIFVHMSVNSHYFIGN
jgi:hypothetical protein